MFFSAKTGQILIASNIFQSLPDAAASEMDVDPIPTPDPAATPSSKKSTPPIDPIDQDLLPECIVYLRLLLILANLDAGKVQEVCHLPRRRRSAKADMGMDPGWGVRDGDGRDGWDVRTTEYGSACCEGVLLLGEGV